MKNLEEFLGWTIVSIEEGVVTIQSPDGKKTAFIEISKFFECVPWRGAAK